MNIIDQLEMEQIKKNIPVFRAGDTLTVHVRILKATSSGSSFFKESA